MSVGTITGHAYPPTGGRLLFIASDGDLFAIGISTTTISVYRSTDGGATWGSAVTTTAGRNVDAISGVTFGSDLIHVAWLSVIFADGMGENSRDVEEQEFNMATNLWTASAVAVVTALGVGDTTTNTDYIGITARTSDRVIVHPGFHSDMGARHRSVVLAHGTHSSWTTEVRVDTVNGNASLHGVTVVGSQAGEAHFVWNDSTADDLEGRTLNASDVLSTKVTLDSTAPTAIVMRGQSIASWDDAGTQRIAISQGSSTTDGSVIRAGEDGGNDIAQDDTSFTDITGGTGVSPQLPALAIDTDNDELHAFFSSTDSDLFRDQSTNGASGDWTTDVEAEDGVTTTGEEIDVIWLTHSSGNGGATVLGYIFDDAGTTKYGEVALAVTHAVTGDAQAVAVTAGASEQVHALTGLLEAVGSAVGAAAQTHVLTAASQTVASAVGVVSVVAVNALVGSIEAVASTVGTVQQTHAVIVTVDAVGEASGVVEQVHVLTGIVSSVAEATGTLTVVHALEVAVAAVAEASGTLTQTHATVGSAEAVAVTAGAGSQTHVLTADSVAVASAVGTLTVVGITPVTGAAQSVVQAAGTPAQIHALVVTADSVASITGTAEQVHAVTVDVVAVVQASGAPVAVGDNKLVGAAQSVAVTTATPTQTQALGVAVAAVVSTVGTPTQTHTLTVSVEAVATASGVLEEVEQLTGIVSSVAEASGTPTQVHVLTGSAQTVASTTANSTQIHAVTGQHAAVSAVTAALDVTVPVTGTAQTVVSTTATAIQVHRLTADSVAVVVATATIDVTKPVTGAAQTVVQAVGTLTVTVVITVTKGSNGVDDALVGSLALNDVLVGAVGMADASVGSMGVDDA